MTQDDQAKAGAKAQESEPFDPALDEQLSFQQAVDRLEETLRRMEEESVDIDDLARELRAATELLELCRAKLRRAELEVEQVMADGFEPSDESKDD